jgi:glycerophosphoryl diester phosphodiesterase
VALAALLLAAVVGPAGATPGDYAVTGHRGFVARGVTENTIASLERARENGATAVELDLRLTGDRHFVVMHDPGLRRTTTCRGRVTEHSLHFIQRHCAGARGHEHIPSLANVLGWAHGKDLNLILEIKHSRKVEWTDRSFGALAGEVRRHGLARRVIYHALNNADLQALKAALPHAHAEAIADSWAAVERERTWADGINVYARDLTEARVRSLHHDGLLVLGRVTNSRADWRRLRRVGVDGLLTDDTAGYRAWRNAVRASRTA